MPVIINAVHKIQTLLVTSNLEQHFVSKFEMHRKINENTLLIKKIQPFIQRVRRWGWWESRNEYNKWHIQFKIKCKMQTQWFLKVYQLNFRVSKSPWYSWICACINLIVQFVKKLLHLSQNKFIPHTHNLHAKTSNFDILALQ